MANFTDSMKEAAFATSPREFDLFQCGGIGKIKFTGAGRECDIFHAASKVIHSFLLSKVRWVADTYCASMRFIFS